MTDKHELLSQFFAGHEPPAQDARFLAGTLAAAQKRRNANAVALWLGAGCVTAAVLALAGPEIANVFNAMGPAVAPIVVTGTVLMMARRRLWARA
ncbi:MAG: hypothetical protein JSS00_09715 [Proteobacteria bacterium]|nr:hypothetical protein [Pseudomonadota bacterium]